MTAKVFISHSSQDDKVARAICSALESRGLNCWLAARDVGPGENFQESIVRAIRSAKLMVLVFSERANNSTEIRKELALASQHRLTVIPARVENVLPSEALAYELATRQWINLFENWEREVERLATWIRDLLGTESLVSTPASPQPSATGAATAQSAMSDRAVRPRRAKPVVAACLMIAVALANVAIIDQVPGYLYGVLPIAVACLLVISAALLFFRQRLAQPIGLGTTGIGIACYIFLFVRMFELMRMGSLSAAVGFIPLAQAAALVVVLAVLLTWRPAKP